MLSNMAIYLLVIGYLNDIYNLFFNLQLIGIILQ